MHGFWICSFFPRRRDFTRIGREITIWVRTYSGLACTRRKPSKTVHLNDGVRVGGIDRREVLVEDRIDDGDVLRHAAYAGVDRSTQITPTVRVDVAGAGVGKDRRQSLYNRRDRRYYAVYLIRRQWSSRFRRRPCPRAFRRRCRGW